MNPVAVLLTPVWRSETRALLTLALPIVMAGLAEMAINTVDVVMMGWLGTRAVASGILGSHYYSVLHFFGLGVLAAVAPLIGQALGARQFRTVRRSLRQGLWVAASLAIPGMLVIWYAGPVLIALRQDAVLVGLTEDYLQARVWGYPGALIFLVLSHLLASHSRPKAIMVVTLVAIVVNAIGNYALMFGAWGAPRLELVGAGVSSAVVDWFAAIALSIFVITDKQFRRYRVFAHWWHPDWPRYLEILRLGLPIAAMVLAEAGLFVAATLMVGCFSEAQLAGHAVAIQCVSIAFMVPYGIGQAAAVRVALAIGKNDIEAVARAGWCAMIWGVGFMLLPASAFWFLGRELTHLYLDHRDPLNFQTIEFAIVFLGIAAVFQLVDGAQCIASGALRGLKDTRVPMWLAAGSYWLLGFGAALLFGLELDYAGVGIWIGLACGLAAAALALTWRFHQQVASLRSPMEERATRTPSS